MHTLILSQDKPVEYFCKSCKQLRLDYRSLPTYYCGNCGSRHIVVGKPGELNKEELLRDIEKE